MKIKQNKTNEQKRNEKDNNNEIEWKHEQKIAFPCKMTKMYLRPSCIQLLISFHLQFSDDLSLILLKLVSVLPQKKILIIFDNCLYNCNTAGFHFHDKKKNK